MRALRAIRRRRVDYLVPNRFDYGYGLTPEIVDLAAHAKPDLIITVDNGIASVEGVAEANELGIATLITDHHLPGTTRCRRPTASSIRTSPAATSRASPSPASA
jgi:single-stranded-DNA-specific exonuclease